MHWRSPREFGPGFVCDFVLSPFLPSTGNMFDLRRGDEDSLAYLAFIVLLGFLYHLQAIPGILITPISSTSAIWF